MKFQVKFYDIIDHNKCPSSKKSAENVFWGNHFFTILNLTMYYVLCIAIIVIKLASISRYNIVTSIVYEFKS